MNAHGRPLDRRTLLRGAGGAAVALPVLDAMLTLGGKLPRVHAADGKPPRRLVILYTGNGFPMDRWRPQVEVGSGPSDFRLSPMLAPFEPFKDRSLFVEGVHMNSSFDPAQVGIGHTAGQMAVLTGAWAGPGNFFDGGTKNYVGWSPYPSIDQVVARAVGNTTRFASYHFGVGTTAEPIRTPFVAEKAKGIAPQCDPRAAFDLIFTEATDATMAARRAAERKTVLDAVRADTRSLLCRLGAEDRRRLDRHLTNVSEIQRRLGVPPPTTSKCQTVRRPDPPAGIHPEFNFRRDIEKSVPSQIDLLAMSLGCDLTRVACLSFNHASEDPEAVYDWLGHNIEHHLLSHLSGADPLTKLEQIGAWGAQQLVSLMTKLESLKEPGGSVLDNTLILWCSEIGDGWTHNHREVAFMLFGGKGYLNGGRYVNFGGGDANSHNRLLLHLAHYMGLETTAVGPAKYCQGGPLPNITV